MLHVSLSGVWPSIILINHNVEQRKKVRCIFPYIIMQLSRLNWWDDFIKLTEDTQYTDWEDQPGDPDPHYLIVWHNRIAI